MEKRSKRKKRIRAVVISVIVGLLAFALYTVLNLGQVFAEEILGELVARQTKGFYSLDFDEIHVDLLEREIQVHDLYLQADSAKITAETGLNTVYEIQLSELIINLKSLFKFYFQKKLEIESMRIVDPEIQMRRIAERQNPTSFSFETGNLYKAISDYLTVLKVDYFRIQDGDLSYNEDQFSMGNIDFQIQNLLLDSVIRNDVFYSETIFLEVQNQKFFLPDSIHEIEFDRFVLSTQDSILRFENLSIHPTPTSGVTFEGDNQVNVYDIHILELALKGIDYQSAYRNDHLIIDELLFSQPSIFIDDETHGKSKKSEKDNSLLKLLFDVFKKVEIGKFSVTDSELDLKINSEETYQRIKSEETSISFYNILLDSSNFQFDQRTRYFENVELSIKNYDYVLPDSIHEVRVGALKLSSKDSILSIRDLDIGAIEEDNQETTISLQVPTIDFYGFVYSDLIEKNLTVKDLLIDRVDLQMAPAKRSDNQEKARMDVTTIYAAVEPFFKAVNIDQFTIGQAGLKLPSGISIGAATLDFTGFKLDNSTRSLQDLFELSYIGLKDVRVNRDTLNLTGGKLELSHDLSEIALTDWDLQVKTKALNLDGTFASLRVVELNPDSLLHGNFMTFRKAFLDAPSFDVDIHSRSEKKAGNGLGIEKEILISDGHFAVNTDSMRAMVTSIDADFYLGDSIAVHQIAADSISMTAPSMNHALRLAKLTYDTTKDELHFIDLDLQPIDPTDVSQSLFQVRIPEVRVKGFVQDQFFASNELIVNELEISQPFISTHVVKKESHKEDSKLSARIDHIRLDSGTILVEGISEGISTMELSGLDVDIAGLNYPESNRLLFAEAIEFSISGLQPSLTSGDQLAIGPASFTSTGNVLRVDSIRFSTKDKSTEILLPSTSIDGLEVATLMENGRIVAENTNFRSPTFSIVKTEKSASKQPTELALDLEHFNMDDISISYTDTTTQKVYAVDDVSLTLDGIRHDGPLDLLPLLQNTQSYAIEGDQLNIPLNPHYSLQTGAYVYTSDREKLAISQLHLNPLQTKTEYSSRLTEQKDWFDASIDQLEMEGLVIREILEDSTLMVGHVLLDGTDLFIYRDKHLPFPEDQEGLLPAEQILSIAYPIKVDTITLKGNVAYEEQPDDFEETGLLTFDNLNARIVNFTNMDIQPGSMMHLNATGQIVEEGFFDVEARFELARADQRFSFKGKVTDLPLDSLNQMLGPVARVNIRSGIAEEIEFQFVANDTLAVGDMVFKYKDLKLQVLNRKKHETNLGSGLMSFFANTFVIRTRNPRFLFPRKGKIYFKRDQSKAIFNYWGKSMLSGAVSSVGIHKSDRQERKDSKSASKEN